jgi:hypothetical protein
MKSIDFKDRFFPQWHLPIFSIASTNHSQPQKGGLIMLNSVVLAGNLGNDPDIHFNSEGEPIASFNLAFRADKKNTT